MSSAYEDFSDTPADVQEITYSNWSTAYGIILTNGTKSVTVDTANSRLKLDCHSNWGSNGAVTAYHSVSGIANGTWEFHVVGYGTASYGEVMAGVIQMDDDVNMVYIENVHDQNCKIWVRANDTGAPVQTTGYNFSSRPYWRIKKEGQIWTVYHSPNGTDWTQEWSATLTEFSAGTTWFLTSGGLAGWGDTIYIYLDYWWQTEQSPTTAYSSSNLKTLIGIKNYSHTALKTWAELSARQDSSFKALVERTNSSNTIFSAKIGLAGNQNAPLKSTIKISGAADAFIKALIERNQYNDSTFKSSVERIATSNLQAMLTIEKILSASANFEALVELPQSADLQLKTNVTFNDQSDLLAKVMVERAESQNVSLKTDITFGEFASMPFKAMVEETFFSDALFKTHIIGINYFDAALKSEVELSRAVDAALKLEVEKEQYSDTQFKALLEKISQADSTVKALVELSQSNDLAFKAMVQSMSHGDSRFKTNVATLGYSDSIVKADIFNPFFKDLNFVIYIELGNNPAERSVLDRILEDRWNLK